MKKSKVYDLSNEIQRKAYEADIYVIIKKI